MKQTIWRKNFSISRTALHMLPQAIDNMVRYQKETIGINALRDGISVFRGYENEMSLIPVRELQAMVEGTINAILKKPAHIEQIHRDTIRYNNEYFRFAHIVYHTDLSMLTTQRLIAIFEKLTHYQKITHGLSLPTTWFVDSDGEDFSKLLIKKIENLIKIHASRRSVAEVFSSLTTPEKTSFAMLEEKESLLVLKRLAADSHARALFLRSNVSRIRNSLLSLKPELRTLILTHYEKWRWVPYTYIGPTYTIDHYLEEWSNMLRKKADIRKRLRELERYPMIVKAKKQKLIRELSIDRATQRLFAIASEIVFIKGYRKDVLYYGCFVLERIHRELMRRFHLSLKQIRFMTDREVVKLMRHGSFPKRVLDERAKFCVYRQRNLQGTMLTGITARRLLASLTIEEETVRDVNVLSGTPACPGSAKGIVRIINVPGDMDKMRKGDIMVSHTTFPALVPAMKKASAIVTDDGGITCHAAIVSRELGTPCVVGTKIATKILKDGDIVEVDATNGTVRKL
ncbi:MAG: PEP-utilizing enzyme [Candidatus Kerfeldbacteria bacterium]